MSSFAGSMTRNSQRRDNVALSEPASNYWKGKSGPAAGRAAFTAPIRHQADGKRLSWSIRRERRDHKAFASDCPYIAASRKLSNRYPPLPDVRLANEQSMN